MGRGEYGHGSTTRVTWGRGTYGVPLYVGRELTDEEIRKARDAGNRASEPLVEERGRMLRAWDPSKPLSREQMTTVMQQALGVARETEKNLLDMIAKVPSHWETFLRREGGLAHLRQGIDEAPGFQAKIDKVTAPTVVPGFRTWIDHLLSRSEDGVIAIGAIADILPDWIRMRDLVSGLHRAAVGLISAIVAVGEAAVDTAKSLPNIVKIAGIGALVVGGVVIVAAVSKRSSTAAAR
jgi:hypothetical protein